MNYILAFILMVNITIGAQIVESEYLYRGVNCELLYMQGRIDAAKDINDLKKYVEDSKAKQSAKDSVNLILDKVQNYQLEMAKLENTSQCVRLELTALERFYFMIIKRNLPNAEQASN